MFNLYEEKHTIKSLYEDLVKTGRMKESELPIINPDITDRVFINSKRYIYDQFASENIRFVVINKDGTLRDDYESEFLDITDTDIYLCKMTIDQYASSHIHLSIEYIVDLNKISLIQTVNENQEFIKKIENIGNSITNLDPIFSDNEKLFNTIFR